ncbi:hypothetical protein BU16DRAFT_536880 [Lophium mytilinum]|uniref:Uncharacterized protein n=1 Tax=Lophium mytilinum TaxID=390894 RepID=A0A6A6R331_9PEZI|nr:hypothetical protein BU16DRAFT_536880 [Lophium mytilinum]
MCMCGPGQQALLHLEEVQLGKMISWKDLREAHFTCPTLLSVIASEDVQLRALTLGLDTSHLDVDKSCRRKTDFDNVRSSLFSQSNLEDLELWNGLPVMVSGDNETDRDLFGHLGRSLRSLTLHENEPGTLGPSPRSIISVASLRLLGETCPRLRSLAVDVPYKDKEIAVVYQNPRTSCRAGEVQPESLPQASLRPKVPANLERSMVVIFLPSPEETYFVCWRDGVQRTMQ